MKNLHIITPIIMAFILLASCSKGDSREQVYYVAVSDSMARHYVEEYPVKKAVEAPSIFPVVTDVMLEINKQLLERAELAKGSDYFKLEPHCYKILVWNDKATPVAVSPEIVESFLSADSLIDVCWKSYPEALEYYKRNTNFFNVPTDMVDVSSLEIEQAEGYLHPASSIKNKQYDISVNELSNNVFAEIVFYAAVFGLIIYLVINDKRKRDREERERLRILERGFTVNITVDTHPAGPDKNHIK